jgi:hypothetical protein
MTLQSHRIAVQRLPTTTTIMRGTAYYVFHSEAKGREAVHGVHQINRKYYIHFSLRWSLRRRTPQIRYHLPTHLRRSAMRDTAIRGRPSWRMHHYLVANSILFKCPLPSFILGRSKATGRRFTRSYSAWRWICRTSDSSGFGTNGIFERHAAQFVLPTAGYCAQCSGVIYGGPKL